MDITIKVNSFSFNEIKEGIKTELKHGYSKNKKYDRLFKKIDKLFLKNENTFEVIVKNFVEIDIVEEKEKKYFILKFK